MFPIPPALIKWLGIAIALAALYGWGYIKGGEHARADLAAYKAQVAARVQAQKAVAARVTQEQQTTTKEINDGYQAELAATHAYYRGLLAHARTHTVRAIPAAAGGAHGTPADALPVAASQPVSAPVAIPDDALHLADDCAATTVQLVNLQAWVGREEGL